MLSHYDHRFIIVFIGYACFWNWHETFDYTLTGFRPPPIRGNTQALNLVQAPYSPQFAGTTTPDFMTFMPTPRLTPSGRHQSWVQVED